LKVIGEILEEISGRSRLSENCVYLLLSKSLNHSLSSFTLAERGLMIDAALSARNGLESLLLLQLCTLDASESLFQRWSNGESFRPAWVRKELGKLDDIEVRDVIVGRPAPDDTYATSYRWLSEITHANLASLNYTVRPTGSEKNFEVVIGGTIRNQETTINAIFSVLCFTLLHTAVLCSVFALHYVEGNKDKLSILQRTVDQTTQAYLAEA